MNICKILKFLSDLTNFSSKSSLSFSTFDMQVPYKRFFIKKACKHSRNSSYYIQWCSVCYCHTAGNKPTFVRLARQTETHSQMGVINTLGSLNTIRSDILLLESRHCFSKASTSNKNSIANECKLGPHSTICSDVVYTAVVHGKQYCRGPRETKPCVKKASTLNKNPHIR